MGNDAGVRCSGCHHITIKNLSVESSMSAVALFGGDFGFEFAPDEQRRYAHQGYLIDGVKIAAARLYGIVLNGAEDNVYRLAAELRIRFAPRSRSPRTR